MRLHDIDFGPVIGASGVQGFYGEGYPHHKWFRKLFPFGFDFNGLTFTAKTTTLESRRGNMQLGDDGLTVRKLFPDCIRVNFREAAVLNAVGLSGPGALFLLAKNGPCNPWIERTSPFFLSFATTATTPELRLKETRDFLKYLQVFASQFKAPFGLQINFSCPNTEHGPTEGMAFVAEVHATLDTLRSLNVPLVPKLNILTPPSIARQISDHSACDALCVSNTIPWGSLPAQINWSGLFGSQESPLAKYGGGGLSGSPIFEPVREWVHQARNDASIRKPIIAGGGVMSEGDLKRLAGSGASAISLGSIAILRPWRLARVIKSAYQVYCHIFPEKKGGNQCQYQH